MPVYVCVCVFADRPGRRRPESGEVIGDDGEEDTAAETRYAMTGILFS